MSRVHLGSVGYLNARPCVVGLDVNLRFHLRFDLPARCAALLHEGSIDVGLVPSIEYLRGRDQAEGYRIVPGVAIASDGPVASVALYTRRPISDVRSIALDTSSRTSVALTRVLCAQVWHIAPAFEPIGPDLTAMLERCDAALLIGDAALFIDATMVRLKADPTYLKADPTYSKTDPTYPKADSTYLQANTTPPKRACVEGAGVEKIDLGETWTRATGLPFVYAFWAGRPAVLTDEDVRAIQAARDAGVADPERVAREYLPDRREQSIGAQYLRDNIKYHLGDREREGLELFYQYAAELGLVPKSNGLRFF